MRYLPKRARHNADLALFLRCCSDCMGDLEFRSDVTGQYYTCLQCNAREDASGRLGRLANLPTRGPAHLPLRGYVAS